jgi:hypothetical protein
LLEDSSAEILTDPGITNDALTLIDSLISNLPAVVGSLTGTEEDEIDLTKLPAVLQEEAGKEEITQIWANPNHDEEIMKAHFVSKMNETLVKAEQSSLYIGFVFAFNLVIAFLVLASDTVSAVNTLATSLITSELPSLDKINKLSKLFKGWKDRQGCQMDE